MLTTISLAAGFVYLYKTLKVTLVQVRLLKSSLRKIGRRRNQSRYRMQDVKTKLSRYQEREGCFQIDGQLLLYHVKV
jgi:hypothetical protein